MFYVAFYFKLPVAALISLTEMLLLNINKRDIRFLLKIALVGFLRMLIILALLQK